MKKTNHTLFSFLREEWGFSERRACILLHKLDDKKHLLDKVALMELVFNHHHQQ